MNLLAHSFLSGEQEEVRIGNLIGDFVKGKQYQQYPEKIQLGILLHRQIDSFTDQHFMAKKSAERLKKDHGRYAKIIVDVFYDHFLAQNFEKYTKVSLAQFAENTYQIFFNYQTILPEKVQKIFPELITDNWFVNYANLEGIKQALQRLDKRTGYKVNFEKAIDNLQQDYHFLAQDFAEFFPDIQQFVKQYLEDRLCVC